MSRRSSTKNRRAAGQSKGDSPRSPLRLSATELLAAMPDACFLVDSRGTLLEANNRALAMMGAVSPQRPFTEILDPDSHDHFSEALQSCILNGAPRSLEVRFAEGAVVELLLGRANASRSEAEPVCFIVAHDISAAKQRERELLQFSNVAEYTVNPIEITDRDGKIVYVNPAFEKASGYSKAELLGKNPRIFGSGKHPRSFWEQMWKTIAAGNVWMGEIENRRRSGEPFYTQLLISPILDAKEGIVGYLGVHRDITHQRQLEQQLIQAQKMESIGTLAAGIAHEVGNPLTSISSLVQVIQRTTSDEAAKDKLELVKSQVTRISKIIRDLVDFSRPSSYEIQLVEANSCVRQAVEIVRAGKKAKDVLFDLRLAENAPPLRIVPDQLQQVFINILINAVDALEESPVGGVEPQVKRITVTTAVDEGHFVVSIHDTGIGISEDNVTRVFEPFFTTKKEGRGTGLGLWVSYGIIKSFQGDIRVQSTPGEGTTFTVKLPLHSE